jgi:hypothetical protein
MAALGVDLPLLVVDWKSDNRGNWGTGFMAGAAGVLLAGCSFFRYEHVRSIRWDVVLEKNGKNAAIRGGLEAAETVSVMPVSLVAALKGF